MSRKHYQEVEFSSPVSASTSSYLTYLPYGGRAAFNEPTKYGNYRGTPIMCMKGYFAKDGDVTSALSWQMEFSVNGVVHESPTATFFTSGAVPLVTNWTFITPLVLNNGDDLTCRVRYIGGGSPGTGEETYVVLIFEWDGDLP